MRPRHTAAGFTLIEAMVAVALMAVLLMIAVPSFNNAALGSQLRASANDLAAAAFLARSEAIKRNAVVTLCMSADGESCSVSGGWEQGWAIVSAGAPLQQFKAAPAGLKITAGAVTSLNFQPTGAGATAAVFTVCRATPSVGREERVVTIDATGRPWIKRTTAAACS
jgi:type IV fimbrial biogenesis protein FimT